VKVAKASGERGFESESAVTEGANREEPIGPVRAPNAGASRAVFFRLGHALRLLRLRAGLRQLDLAQRAGIVPSAISRFEREGSRPRIEVLEGLLEAMGASLVDLVAALLVVQQSAEGVRGRRAAGATEDLPQLSSRLASCRVGRQAARLCEGVVERQS